MKNKANLNSLNLNASTCGRGTYSVLRTKTKNGTKPNEANSKPISEMENLPPSKKTKKWKTNPILQAQGSTQVFATEALTIFFCPKIQKETNPNKPN